MSYTQLHIIVLVMLLPDALRSQVDELLLILVYWFVPFILFTVGSSLPGDCIGLWSVSKSLELSIRSLCLCGTWSQMFPATFEDSFTQQLESKIKTSNWKFPLYLNTRKSHSLISLVLTNASQPASRTNSFGYLVTATVQVLPLHAFSSILPGILSPKRRANLFGMICKDMGAKLM